MPNVECLVPLSSILQRSSHLTFYSKISDHDLCKHAFPHSHFFSPLWLTLALFHSQTDDYGVFNTTLTKELTIAAETYALGKDELIELTESANLFSFARPHDRQLICDKIEKFKKKMRSQL
jgi:hypothetical protein